MVFFVFDFNSPLGCIFRLDRNRDRRWAECLPTPNLTSSKRSLTLYHVFMAIFLLLVLNSLFFIKPKKFTWKNFLYSLYVAFAIYIRRPFLVYSQPAFQDTEYFKSLVAFPYWVGSGYLRDLTPPCHNYVFLGNET